MGSISPRLGIWGVSLELMAIGVVGWTNEVSLYVYMSILVVYILVLIHVCVHVCVLVCVAPPMVVVAWSMAEALRQLFEYYI